MINADLSVFSFRVNSGVPEFSIDGGTTWNKLGGGSMPTLDFAHPLKTFGVSDSYTVDSDCYLYVAFLGGTLNGYKQFTNLKVDDKVVCVGIGTDPSQCQGVTIKLTTGQVVTTDGNYGTSIVYILTEL